MSRKMVERSTEREGRTWRNGQLLPNLTPSEELTSHSPTTIEVSDDEHEKEPIDVTLKIEWISKVDTMRQVVEILGKCMNEVDKKFYTLKGFTLEENDNIRNDLDGHKHEEYEMK
uniref:Uncharacterized protein n=1 Tax=Solanum tuberosum TaxID=4113 RepID=M1DWP1_SOLTU